MGNEDKMIDCRSVLETEGHEGIEKTRVQVTIKAMVQWKGKLSGSKVVIKG